MKDIKPIVVFDAARRTFDIYKDVSGAAEAVEVHRSRLEYNILNHGVFYTGSCFVGYGAYHKSKRGGNKAENQGFKNY